MYNGEDGEDGVVQQNIFREPLKPVFRREVARGREGDDLLGLTGDWKG